MSPTAIRTQQELEARRARSRRRLRGKRYEAAARTLVALAGVVLLAHELTQWEPGLVWLVVGFLAVGQFMVLVLEECTGGKL